MTLIMHQPNASAFRTAAIKIIAPGAQHRVVLIRMQRPRRRLELVRIKMVLLPQVAGANQRQNVPLMQFPANPVVVHTAVGHKGLAPTTQVRINQPIQQRLTVRVLIVTGRYHIEVNRQLPVESPSVSTDLYFTKSTDEKSPPEMLKLRQICRMTPDAALALLLRTLNVDLHVNLEVLSGVLCHVGNSRRDKSSVFVLRFFGRRM